MIAILLPLIVLPQAAIERPLPIARRFLRKGHKFIVCAHRGDHTVAPENSLEAYDRAIKIGADFGEVDLRMTKDGVIVLMHDATVDRTTDGHGTVSNLTLQEIKALKFKRVTEKNESVPTFEELLKAVRGKINLYLDIKAVRAKDVLPLLKKYRMERNAIAYVYGPANVDEWRQDAPEIPIISDISKMTDADQIEQDWRAHPFAITDGRASGYTQQIVDIWHKLGVVVFPDIQSGDEGPEKWAPVIEMGVDGLQTDHPGELIRYLNSRGIR
jgi:glycerophosphoryl diester phosphodiesterase